MLSYGSSQPIHALKYTLSIYEILQQTIDSSCFTIQWTRENQYL